ncbi:MAG: adenylate/guanylate cyclase domain-containing protein, partial [Mycobacterium sp.]|nr:adenylate/guanylate cyclase domain-containing protein [Mycobacterium sp.]
MAASSDQARLVPTILEDRLLGGPQRYNHNEVAELAGIDRDTARGLWIALGFPATDDDQALDYTEADIKALADLQELGIFAAADPRRQAAAARAIGQAMARLAEWQADVIVDEITRRSARDSDADPAAAVRAATDNTLELLERLQTYTWRRHLAAALSRPMDDPEAAGSVRTLAIGFADMVGYTRLTRHLHPDELSTLLEAFESTSTAAVTENGGWVIKNLGDEVMFAAETALAAARIGLAIQHSTMTVGATPQLRVAIAYGPVLQRLGDLYGTVVNTAARLTGVARPGTVLVDDRAAEELANEPEFTLRS